MFFILDPIRYTLKMLPKTYTTFFNKKMAAILCLSFSSGVPLALTGGTLQAWMSSQKVDLTVIGIFSLVSLPYTLKFLWAPFMDRYVPRVLGRRKGWIFITQVALILALSAMAFCDPVKAPGLLAGIAFLVAFCSASQDIVIDAYRAEVLTPLELGNGAAINNFGYRMAMLFSGAFALILSDHLSWRQIYLLMAAAVGLGLITTLLISEPAGMKASRSLKEAFVGPLQEFFSRKGVLEVILFIVIYKLDVVVTLAMMTPFFMQLGFSKTDIGAVMKGFGLLATLTGTFAGGFWMIRLGIERSLWYFGILQGISGLCFYFLAKVGHHYPLMVASIATENFFSGMGNAAYAAFLMSLCNPQFTATQFALLTSLMAVTRTLIGAPTGWMAKNMGWEHYYLIAMLLSIPGLLILTRYKKWSTPSRSLT